MEREEEENEQWLSHQQHTVVVCVFGVLLCIGITYGALYLLTNVILKKK